MMMVTIIALYKARAHLITFHLLVIWENDSLFTYLKTETQRVKGVPYSSVSSWQGARVLSPNTVSACDTDAESAGQASCTFH